MRSIKEIHSALPIAEKIAVIESSIITYYYGDRTIPCCMPHDGGITGAIRRWQVEDFAHQAIPAFRCNEAGRGPAITAADWLNNENSTSFSGEYLLSQVYRYEATRDPAALGECRRALRGIRTISDLAGPDRFGWLCKVWGERVQESSSPDQNVCAISGMWSYLPYASEEEASFIRAIIPAIARYWERIDYTIEFGDHVWSMHDDTAHMRMYIMFNLLAHSLSGDTSFLEVAQRLEDTYGDVSVNSVTLFDTFAEREDGYFSDWRLTKEFAGATMLFAPLQMNIQAQLTPKKREQYLQAWQRVIEHGLIGYDRQLRGHYYDTLVKCIAGRYYWRPLDRVWGTESHEALMKHPSWAFGQYPQRVMWMDATARMPLSYMLYLQHGGTKIEAMDTIVREVFNSLDSVRLHWMVDMHHDQTVPELEYMLHGFSSEIPALVAAYHLGCGLNFWE